MSIIEIVLCEQDLADFLEDNEQWMEAYRAELERRLADRFGSVTVEIDRNSLQDKIIGCENDLVLHVMNEMGNDWSWL